MERYSCCSIRALGGVESGVASRYLHELLRFLLHMPSTPTHRHIAAVARGITIMSSAAVHVVAFKAVGKSCSKAVQGSIVKALSAISIKRCREPHAMLKRMLPHLLRDKVDVSKGLLRVLHDEFRVSNAACVAFARAVFGARFDVSEYETDKDVQEIAEVLRKQKSAKRRRTSKKRKQGKATASSTAEAAAAAGHGDSSNEEESDEAMDAAIAAVTVQQRRKRSKARADATRAEKLQQAKGALKRRDAE